MSLFNPKGYNRPKCVKTVYGGGKKQSEENISKIIGNLLKLKKENEAIKDRTIRDIGTLFKQEDDYYKPIRVGNLQNNNYIEYDSCSDRDKNLSVKEYLDKINSYLRDIIINFQKSDE